MKLRPLSLIFILMAFVNVSCQTNNNKKETTNKQILKTKISGVYKYGDNPENGPTGMITVYEESDGSILFYLDISRGAPSYNMGNLYDRVKIKFNKGIYYFKDSEDDNSCSFSFAFTDNKLTIKTVNNGYNCGFGGNVTVDGEYYKVKHAKFDHFIDMTGIKYFFEKTKPEDYAKIPK